MIACLSENILAKGKGNEIERLEEKETGREKFKKRNESEREKKEVENEYERKRKEVKKE